MHRVQFGRLGRYTRDANTYCIWSDSTECDYGNFNGVIDAHEQSIPWGTGNHEGINPRKNLIK